MARMFNPPHPGLTLRDDVLPALGLTVTQAAQQLDVSRVTLSRVLNGRAAVSQKWPCASKPGWVRNVAGMPACGWPNRAPMTCGRQRNDSRTRPCTFNLRQRWPDPFAPARPASKPG